MKALSFNYMLSCTVWWVMLFTVLDSAELDWAQSGTVVSHAEWWEGSNEMGKGGSKTWEVGRGSGERVVIAWTGLGAERAPLRYSAVGVSIVSIRKRKSLQKAYFNKWFWIIQAACATNSVTLYEHLLYSIAIFFPEQTRLSSILLLWTDRKRSAK